MGGFGTAIVVAVTMAVISAIMTGARSKGMASGPESFTVRFHGGVLAIGIICMLLFGAMLCLALYQLQIGESIAADDFPFIFGAGAFFFLLGAVLAVAAARFRLRVEFGRIINTPILGRSYVLRPADIAYAEVSPTKLKAFDANHCKLFSVDPTCKGKLELEDWLRRYGVRFGRDVSAGEALAVRLRSIGKKAGREYVIGRSKSAREREKQWRERNRQYMETPADLPENMEELMRPYLRRSIGLIAGEAAVHCVIGRSKFGGEPDLPPGFSWDYFEGEAPVFGEGGKLENVVKSHPLAFLLQINCQEVSALYPESPLPKHGLLSFFYEMDTMLWGPELLGKIGYVKAHYFESTEGFVRTPYPEDLDERYRILQHPIILHKEASLPPLSEFSRYSGMEFTRSLANHRLYSQYRAGMGVEHSGHGEMGMDSRLFGWPESIQNDVFDEFLNEYLKDRAVDSHPANLGTGAEDEWELLLQLSSSTYDEMGAGSIMFGDYGNLYFAIRKEDLAAKRFDRVWFTLQCT